MLFNPKWKSEPVNMKYVMSLRGLIDWMETQPPEKTYDWRDCRGGCLIGMYFKHWGFGQNDYGYDKIFENCKSPWAYGKVCSSLSGPTTIGAALERARELQRSEL